MHFRKIEFDEGYAKNRKQHATKDSLAHLQTAVYVMAGGGFLGQSAACQPASFYIDARCGKLPYPKRAILQAVQALVIEAGVLGVDPNNLPPIARWHNCGVF